MKIDHKIVCWGDYAIPVPLWANWIAMNADLKWFFYEKMPSAKPISIFNNMRIWRACTRTKQSLMVCSAFPPESGSWKEQLYWIGD